MFKNNLSQNREEIERIKALLFSGEDKKEKEKEDLLVQKIKEEVFNIKPANNTLKGWIQQRKESQLPK